MLARVEGEGGMHIEIEDKVVKSVKLKHLRAAAVLRGLPSRTQVHRAAGHHGAHLRHLPRRVSDGLHEASRRSPER